ncbi:decorin-like [Lytechinus variegatus]|uniref:decorin-like n=1 Tax=Lytechinus variegatus TaxID=7654 RepID=UPI001BB1E9D2|nr:decorin-like [Lytechinus variegatus]
MKFSRYNVRDAIYRNRMKLRGSKVYIHEDLTSYRSSLIFKARTSVNVKKTWTSDGKITAFTNNGRKVRIACERDLENLDSHSRCSSLCECKQRRTLVDVTCTDLDDMPQDLPCNTGLLDLKSNSITALKKESFSCLGSLIELLLTNNRIRLIEKGVFEDTTQLQYIELDSNFLQRVPYLGTLPALLKLSVNRNSLKEWQQQTLRDPSGQSRCSNLCECKQGRTLVDVTCTDLDDIPQDLPCNTVLLDLKSNSITALKKESFSCLGSLIELLLTNNRIRLIEKGVFEDATQLQYIELDSNSLQRIPYLGTLPALLKLSVNRNSLKEWQQQTLRDPSGHSRCSNLCECKQRRTLVYVTCTDLDDMPQDLPCNTVLLDLKSNSITALKKESFSCLVSLVELLLSNNRIHLIEKGVFEDATQLEYIELDSNFLQRIPYLGPLPALLKISVTRNSLKEWQQQTLRDPSVME